MSTPSTLPAYQPGTLAHLNYQLHQNIAAENSWLMCQHHTSCIPDSFIPAVKERFTRAHKDGGFSQASSYLNEINNSIKFGAISISASDSELCEFAKRRATECIRIKCSVLDTNSQYMALVRVTESYGIPAQNIGRKYNIDGAIMRMCDEYWWRRRLRHAYGRRVEALAIQLGNVHRFSEIYVSNESYKRRRGQKAKTRQLLAELEATNELGQSYSLQELAELSISNPVIRRCELMVRMAGFEKYAQEEGYVGEFYTITCPSRMHARYAKTGHENPKYDGTTPEEAQRHLSKQFSKIRSALKRRGMTVFGFRVAEPQHDGTPHWHLLLFMRPEHTKSTRDIFSHYALEHDGDEPGAEKHRLKIVPINWGIGTATGYIAKYIAKNIDGFGLDTDVYGNNSQSTASRIDAYASTWGIRQFQQIGGPPVGIWRELRRSAESDSQSIEMARNAADSGDWYSFIKAMGGVLHSREHLTVQLLKVHSDKPNRYGETIGNIVIGVQAGMSVAISRTHEWQIQRIHCSRGNNGLTTGQRPVVRVADGPRLGAARAGVGRVRHRPPGSPCQAIIAEAHLEFCQ